MHRNNSKRKIVIYSLLGVLLLMTVGYASFQSSLKIKGTSKVSSIWDVEITNVTSGTSTGSAENGKDENGNVVLPSWDKLSASISSDLYESGDSMTYVVTIENKGTLDAKIDDIIPSQKSGNDNVVSNDGVKITFSGYTKGQMLYKSGQSGNKMDITVKVEYNDGYTGGPTSLETNLQFNFVQAESKEVDNNEVISENSHKVTYDYISNGGDKKTYERYYQEGEEIDLTIGTDEKYDLKDEYIFLGWNTDSSSTEKLETLTMGDSDIYLYATYEEDNIELNVSWTSTTNTITIVASSQADSGIVKYEYSIDKGKTYIESDNNIHTFENLESGYEYPIRVRVTSNTKKKTIYSGYEEIGIPTNNLLFWGSADNTDNTTTILKNKVSGTDGTLNNFNDTETSGYNGTDLVFDGVDDYVDIGYANYDFQNSISYVMNVKINQLRKQILFGSWSHSVSGNSNGASGLYFDGTAIKMDLYNGKQWSGISSGNNISDKEYYTIIGIYDADHSIKKLYFNGVLENFDNAENNLLINSSNSIKLGTYNNGTDNKLDAFSNMSLKEAMIYDRALSEEEVINITNNIKNKYNQGTSEIEKPMFKESTSGNVIITYPNGCSDGTYICTYQKDDNNLISVTSTEVSLKFSDSGNVVAKVSDEYNIVSASYHTDIKPIMMSGPNFQTIIADYKETITEIEFMDNKIIPENVVSWDVSQYGNGSVLAWLVGTKLYIGGTEGVIANKNNDSLFKDFNNVTAIEFNDNYDTNSTTNMATMFYNCNNLVTLNLSTLDTHNVTKMNGMFDVTDGTISHLKNITFGEKWDTSKVTDMSNMFCDCHNIESLDISMFDTSKVTNMAGMFARCYKLLELDLSNFNTSNVENIRQIFENSKSIKTIYVSENFVLTNATNHVSMFRGTSSLVGGTGTTFNSSYVDKTYATIDRGKSNPGYLTFKNDNYEQTSYYSLNSKYINVGINPTNSTKFALKINMASTTGSNIIGSGAINGESLGFRFFNANNIFYLDYGSGSGYNRISGGTWSNNVDYELEVGNRYVKNLSTGINIISGTSVGAFNITANIKISGYNATGKLYYFRLWSGSTLIRDMIPVTNISTPATTIGMYDLVNKKIYTPTS